MRGVSNRYGSPKRKSDRNGGRQATIRKGDPIILPSPPASVRYAFKHVKAGNAANPDLQAKQVVAIPGDFDPTVFGGPAFDVGSVTLENDPSVNVLAVVKAAAAFIRSL